MRVKRYLMILSAAFCLLLCGCVPVADTPADELRQYSWSTSTEYGCEAALSFDGLRAGLDVKKAGLSMEISGVYALTDDKLTIFDEEGGESLTFGYKLYGDRVELSFEGGTLSLEKDGK